MANFRFTNELSRRDVGHVVGLLRRPRLWIPTETDYPDHDAWLQKVESQLTDDKKRALLALDGQSPIGTVVYQRHEDRPDILEIRNISVIPESKGRYVGSFLLRNTEIEGVANDFPGVETVMVDTKISNEGMIRFLERHGYEISDITDLYEQGAGLDVVLTKQLAAV